MKLAINQNALQTAIDPIVKSIICVAATASLVGIGYCGSQAIGRRPMYVASGAISTLGLAAYLAQSLVPKSKTQLLKGKEEEEAAQPATKKRGKA